MIEHLVNTCVSSKCTTQVYTQVNKHMNTLLVSLDCDETFFFSLFTYKGPVKSVSVKDGSIDTLSVGKLSADRGLNAISCH